MFLAFVVIVPLPLLPRIRNQDCLVWGSHGGDVKWRYDFNLSYAAEKVSDACLVQGSFEEIGPDSWMRVYLRHVN